MRDFDKFNIRTLKKKAVTIYHTQQSSNWPIHKRLFILRFTVALIYDIISPISIT